MSFLSDVDYRNLLDERIRCVDDAVVREHIKEKLNAWAQQYGALRLIERAAELLVSEQQRPNMLYLCCDADLHLLRILAQRHRFDARLFRGFLVADSLWDSLQPDWFSPFPVRRVSDWQDRENTVVLSLSADRPLRADRDDRGNDYRDWFIDLSRLSVLADIRRASADRPVVLFADYRKVKTIEAIAEAVSHRYTTVGLICDSREQDSGYQHVIRESLYLWPLVFKTLEPDIVHVNVGWGTQGLPFMPFVSDRQRAVLDFYDVVDLVPEELRDDSGERRVLTRAVQRYLWTKHKHFVHRCFQPVTDDLKKKYPDNDIVSVVEYVKKPVYSRVRCGTDDLKLVYAGIIIQDAADTESAYYRRFMDMANLFAKDNLHLHIYPSPYLYGFGKPQAVEELIRAHKLTNVHACEGLEEDEFIEAISECDYGVSPPADTKPCPYPHSLPFKVISYLRAGLPIVVPKDLVFLANLVEKHKIGVVYGDEDSSRIPELLASQDLRALKENVVRFRALWDIDKGGAKVAALYDRILQSKAEDDRRGVEMEKPPASAPTSASETGLSSGSILSLEGRTFLSEEEYTRHLNAGIEQAGPGLDKDYVRRKYQGWAACYHIERMRQRAEEMLGSLRETSYALYVDSAESLQVMARIISGGSSERLAGLRGLVIEDDLLARLDTWDSGSHRVVPRSRAREIEATIFSVSGELPADGAGNYLANDYRERFIDLRRYEPVRKIARSFEGCDVVLYPLYREIQTASIMAKFVRRKDERIRSLSLSPGALLNSDFDAGLTEPFFYLWPLLFRLVDPAMVHLNVGWGVQALAFSPFVPSRERTVVDFYEVLSFLPDGFFEKAHSTAEEVRSAEKHFFQSYDHVMHLCSDETSEKLVRKYDHHGSLVSVTEYLEEPTYNSPPRNDGEIRLVYGGAMLATNSPDDFYYRPFLNVVDYYTRENLRLYIYNSPYINGVNGNRGLNELIQSHGLTNVHACKPLKLEDFVQRITEYDYGLFMLLARDMQAGEHYNYYMAYKFLTYLRAGLPIVIDADNRYLAGLVDRYNLGVVFEPDEIERLPSVLNNTDLAALKRNVVEYRSEFSLEKGGAKVLRMYHEILGRSERKGVFPVGNQIVDRAPKADRRDDHERLIKSMAEAENRLYYRDQSAQTISSLAKYAHDLKPSVIVELGTLAGLSLRTWVTSTEQAKIYAVDLSFGKLRETMQFLPVDLSRVTLLEQDILKTDFSSLWTSRDKVIFFIDAHDLPNVPIMEHVLTTVLPTLPDGSLIVVDDLWFSEERLTQENARSFLENRVVGEVDELQCFEGHYAPYHAGGSFMGFAEAIPFLAFVNGRRIELTHEPGSKHASFVWKKDYLLDRPDLPGGNSAVRAGECGCASYNPLESVPPGPSLAAPMHDIATLYRRGQIQEVFKSLSGLLTKHPYDQGVSYGLAVCLARGGMLSQARDILAKNASGVDHPRYQRLLNDLVQRIGPSASQQPTASQQPAESLQRLSEGGLTIFAMPKPFVGHLATIQKNAIRSWTRLRPAPEIILIGDEAGTREMAEDVGARHIPNVRRNEFGTPLVDYIFQTAQDHASHSVMAYVNADMILSQSFATGVQKVQAELSKFLLIGQRWDLPIVDEIDFSQSRWQELLTEQVQEHGTLHAECGIDYFVFPKGLYPEIPPFAIGRTAWDNWLVMTPHKLGVPVVDGTEFIMAVHQDHDYAHVAGGRDETWTGTEAQRNRALAGPIDSSGLSCGARRALRKDGALIEVPRRQCWYMTAEYRAQRSAWLLKQADRLAAIGRKDLAAGKWEEAVAFQEILLASGWPGDGQSESMSGTDLARGYATTCLQLAHYHAEKGHYEQAAATYTRLLENPSIQMPAARRDKLAAVRDRLAHSIRSAEQSGDSPAAVKQQSAAAERRPVQADPPPPQKATPAAVLTLPAGNCADVDESRMKVLAGLERTYRSIPNRSPAKHAGAIRLAELFRRAGLADKSRSYRMAANALKDVGDAQGGGRCAGECPPRVAVITACWNAEQYLAECLDSILDQTMTEWELFLLDDGSTDGTRRIINEYAQRDARIRAYCFDDRTGPYVRRNFAIERARAPFIVIHDADDIMCPTKLEALYREINTDDRLGMVGSSYRTFLDTWQGPEYSEYNHLSLTHDRIMARFKSWCHAMSHGSAIIRRSLFGEIGLYDENPFAADSFWSAKLATYAEAGNPIRTKNISNSLTLVRMHATNYTRTLSTLDPRNRRARYRQYCECKLRRIQERMKSMPGTDIGRELRECRCGDFLTRFRAQIIAWESEPLDDRVIPEFLRSAFCVFREGYYISCANILNGVESFEPGVARRVVGYDLFRGMAFFAVHLKERSRMYLDREIQHHDNPAARKFEEDAFASSPGVDVAQWFRENAERYNLSLVMSDNAVLSHGVLRPGVAAKQ